MKCRTLKPFWVVGVKAKTDLAIERHSDDGKAFDLWSIMLDMGRMFCILWRVNRIEYLTLTTDYQGPSDTTCTLIAGQRVKEVENIPEGLEAFRFDVGDYLVFPARGEKQEAVNKTHDEIEAFFAANVEWERRWTTDFEVSGKIWNQTDIYISVQHKASEA